jgi:hypothetical protein
MTPQRQLLVASSLFLLMPALAEARCVIELESVWRITPIANPTAEVFQGVVHSATKVRGGQIAIVGWPAFGGAAFLVR